MARQRRAGATETFSVSVDRETKEALRALADADFGGNLSALITHFAEDARRRKAAGDYLRRHGIPKLSGAELEKSMSELAAEVAAAKKRSSKKRAPKRAAA